MRECDSLVVVLGDRRYHVERPWGELPSDMEFGPISQLALDSAGRVYVFQRAEPPVLVFEPSGKFRAAWGRGCVADAHGIFISPEDRVFLVDRDAHQVLIFTVDGTLVGALYQRALFRTHVPISAVRWT